MHDYPYPGTYIVTARNVKAAKKKFEKAVCKWDEFCSIEEI